MGNGNTNVPAQASSDDFMRYLMQGNEPTGWEQYGPWFQAVLGGLGQGVSAYTSGKRSDEDRKMQWYADLARRRDAQAMSQAAMMMQFLEGIDSRDRAGLMGWTGGTGDPYFQNWSRARPDLTRQVNASLQPYTIGPSGVGAGGYSIPAGGFDLPSLSNEALDQSRNQFEKYLARVSPHVSLSAASDPARLNKLGQLDDYQSGAMNFINQMGQTYEGTVPYPYEKQGGGGGGGFWNAFKKYAPLALSIVAPYTMPLWAGIAAGAGVGALANKGRGARAMALGAGLGAGGQYLGYRGTGNMGRGWSNPFSRGGTTPAAFTPMTPATNALTGAETIPGMVSQTGIHSGRLIPQSWNWGLYEQGG